MTQLPLSGMASLHGPDAAGREGTGMIQQDEFTAEIAEHIESFIRATQGKSEEKIKDQSRLCSELITCVAQVTDFRPPTKKEAA